MTDVARIRYGWFSPDGTIHECDEYGHSSIAESLTGLGLPDPVRVLQDNGYVRISYPYLEVRYIRNPETLRALRKLLTILHDAGIEDRLEVIYLRQPHSYMSDFHRGTPLELLTWLSEME